MKLRSNPTKFILLAIIFSLLLNYQENGIIQAHKLEEQKHKHSHHKEEKKSKGHHSKDKSEDKKQEKVKQQDQNASNQTITPAKEQAVPTQAAQANGSVTVPAEETAPVEIEVAQGPPQASDDGQGEQSLMDQIRELKEHGGKPAQLEAGAAQPPPDSTEAEVAAQKEAEAEAKKKAAIEAQRPKLDPHAKTGIRSKYQLPDIDVATGQEVDSLEAVPEKSAIETSSSDDMNAYATTLNNGGAAHVLEVLEPVAVNAEEDNGSVALLMEDTAAKVETIDGVTKDEPAAEDSGADFAAQFAMDIKNKQKAE